MNVDTMRTIDKYAGIPLTFVVTIIDKISKLLSPQKKKEPKNVLFIELSEMGSAILVDPAMRKLKKEINNEIYFVIFKKNKISLQLLNTVKEENIYTINEDGLKNIVLSTLGFFKWCREKNIDSVIDLELFSRFTALLTFASGATNRVGFHAFHNEGLYRGDLLTHKVAYNPHQHIAKSFIALVDTLLLKEEETPYLKREIKDDEIVLEKANISDDEKEDIYKVINSAYPKFDKLSNKIVLVNSNASDLLPERRWDRKNYAILIKMMLQDNKDIIILLTGAPSEFEGVDILKRAVNSERCINFAGSVGFLQLPALYSVSEFMITNDSGPAHFAAITQMHTYVIFGPETPKLYGSLGPTTPIYSNMSCSPCVSAANHRKTACNDNKCIQVITPVEIFNVVKKQINKF